MSEPLQNTESPLFFSTLGNLSGAEASAELSRLQSQQTQIRAEINRVKNEKESNGAKLIRCKSSLKNDCGELEYQLNQFVNEYYRLQSQDEGLTKEIARLQAITKGFKGADGDMNNEKAETPAIVSCPDGKHIENGICVEDEKLLNVSAPPFGSTVAFLKANYVISALVIGLIGYALYQKFKTKKS
jgi:hypothetical protein